MEKWLFVGVLVFIAAVGIWQAVAVWMWVAEKLRKPVVEKQEDDAVQRSLDRIVKDLERQEENEKCT